MRSTKKWLSLVGLTGLFALAGCVTAPPASFSVNWLPVRKYRETETNRRDDLESASVVAVGLALAFLVVKFFDELFGDN